MLQGVAIAADQTLIPSQPWYGKPVKYDYDPEKAKALLKEAGCMPCKIKVGISTSGSGQMQPLPMNELVKEQLEAVGFKVDLSPMDWNALIGVFLAGANKFDYNAINFSMAPIEPLQGIIEKWTTAYAPPNCCNWGFFKDPKVDQLGDEGSVRVRSGQTQRAADQDQRDGRRRTRRNSTSFTISIRALCRPRFMASCRRRAGSRI